MHVLLFYLFSGLAVLTSLLVVFASKPTRALLSLILTMLSLAVLFLLLGAYFIAMVHVIVYAGAVLVLFLFVIMFQGVGAKDLPLLQRFHPFFFILTGTVIIPLAALFGLFFNTYLLNAPQAHGFNGQVEVIGMILFQRYLLPFELISVALLLGVFAAIALAKKEDA